MRDVLLLGGTGAIGQAFATALLATCPEVQLTAWARPRSLGKLAAIAHPRLAARAVDLDRPREDDWPAGLEVVVNCMGSNYVDADPAEVWRVDHDLALALAAEARRRGATTCVLLSALGAHPRSPVLFLRAKGALAVDLGRLGFARLAVVAPGFVVDSTVPRTGYERALLALNVALAPALVGPLARLRPTTCAAVAAELVAVTGLAPG